MNRVNAALVAGVLSLVMSAGAQNLVQNPGFEDGDAFWMLWDGSNGVAVAEVTYPASGGRNNSAHARVVVTQPADENWQLQFQVPPDWEAVNGVTYELRFWARSKQSSSIHVAVQDGPANNYGYRTGTELSLTTDWEEYVVEHTSDQEGNGAMRLNLYVGGSADTLDFDDFSLKPLTAGVRSGAVVKMNGSLRVAQGAGGLRLSLDAAAHEGWKAELFDLRGKLRASASGRADGTALLPHPREAGTYFIRARTATQSWMRKVMIQ